MAILEDEERKAVDGTALRDQLSGVDKRCKRGKTIVVVSGRAGSLVRFRGPLLESMAAHGHRVVASAPDAPKVVGARLNAMGVACHDLPLERTTLSPLRDAATMRALLRLFRTLRPDVILTYTIKAVVYGSLAGRLVGVPERFSMITGLGYAFGGGDIRARLVGVVSKHLCRVSLKGAQRVFFQNPDDRDAFERLRLLSSPRQAVLVNGSGVDLAHYAPAPLPKQPSFLMLARMLRAKGIPEYVEAARILRMRYPLARFCLAGPFDPSPLAISKAEVEGWVQDGTIEYLGYLDDVRAALAEASVYVLPSYYPEGQPRSVLEAMAMGRPIVTTDAPGCRETVADGHNGFLVPVRDANMLAAAMERFIRSPELVTKMGAESRRLAEMKYDVHKVNAVILEAMGLA